MGTKFRDVAHLYLGCQMYSTPQSGEYCIEKLTSVDLDVIRINGDLDFFPFDSKPILRKLSDMTEDEKIYVGLIARDIELHKATERDKIFAKEDASAWAIRKGMRPVMDVANCVKLTTYLLQQGLDAFGLIESGEAIDRATLTNK